MPKERPRKDKRRTLRTNQTPAPLPPSTSTSTSTLQMTSSFIDEYESVGERGAYRNAVLADKALRAHISSPTDSRTAVEGDAATPPPVMIPLADMLREMAEDQFLQFTEDLATTVVKEVKEPINYHRVTDQPNDNNDPGLPFFPNKPSSFRYYPLLIHTNNKYHATQVVAPFIYYHNQGQEVVGTMGRDKPLYARPIYLSTPNLTHLPIPITNSQLLQFSRENPRAYAIDKTLRRLEDPRIDAEVSHLREKLELQIKIEKQLDDLRQQ